MVSSGSMQERPLRKAAVLGAGTMGSRIAAHLANAGVAVVLLDIVPPNTPTGDTAQRNKIVMAALDGLKKAKPAAFFDAAFAARIVPGNFDDHLEMLRDCDWVIEVVAEDLAIKQALLQKIAPFCREQIPSGT